MIDFFAMTLSAITGVIETQTPFLSRVPEFHSTARQAYDVDLPADAVREMKPTRALPAPLIEGDSDGGECD